MTDLRHMGPTIDLFSSLPIAPEPPVDPRMILKEIQRAIDQGIQTSCVLDSISTTGAPHDG